MVLWLRRLKTQEAFDFVHWNHSVHTPLALHQLGEGAALEGWSTQSLRMSPVHHRVELHPGAKPVTPLSPSHPS